MNTKVFKSAISWWLMGSVLVLLIGTSVIMLLERAWLGLLINASVIIFFLHLILNTYYQIKENKLIIVCGILFKLDISIDEIKDIQPTNNPLSSPALSLDRLAIRYGSRQTVMISPKNKEGFIHELLLVNPTILVKEK
jgi:uridine kinase